LFVYKAPLPKQRSADDTATNQSQADECACD
jgi:hypothetical protein